MDENGIKTEKNRIKDEKGLFVKGNPGSPGRPKGSFSLVEMIKAKLQEQAVKDGKKLDKTYADFFIEQMMRKAVLEGDVSLMRDIIDRVDGKPKQNVGLGQDPDAGPVEFMDKTEKKRLLALLGK